MADVIVELLGDAALRSLGLLQDFHRDDLREAVVRGAWLHDLGKANSHFQRMIYGRDRYSGRRLRQAFRHEYLSAWLVTHYSALDTWLFGNVAKTVRMAALLGALHHHLKLPELDSLEPRTGSGDDCVEVLADHVDFSESLAAGKERLRLGVLPVLPRVKLDLSSRPLRPLAEVLMEASSWLEDATDATQRFVALVKALVIAADVAASAAARVSTDTDTGTIELDPAEWSRAAVTRVCTAGALDREVIAPQKAKLIGLGETLRPFQEAMGSTDARVTLVRAGCGSGKTLGAYLWARRHADGRRLFFCYPTTGTATEGFRDYVHQTGIAPDSELLHGRAEVDLESLAATPEQPELEVATRLEALRAWEIQVAICTVDQVLGIIANSRRPLFASPAIVRGAFVFDEVHLYDEALFGALLRFLDAFRGAPILIMTASLQESRRRAIDRHLRVATGESLEIIEGPRDLEEISRYTLVGPVAEPPWDAVEATLRRGGKVMWVANTVQRCVALGCQAANRLTSVAHQLGVPIDELVLAYHSRYRYHDRVDRHNAVITAFGDDRAVLAVTTQVCEVSLDISADLLITDLAPVPALIQRLGRLNRRVSETDHGTPCPAFVLEIERQLPYESGSIHTARHWLAALASEHGDSPLSQRNLRDALATLEDTAYVPACHSAWLDGGVLSTAQPLRQAGQTIPIIRGEDVTSCHDRDARGRPTGRWIIRNTIPMLLGPVAAEMRGWQRHRHVFEAPAGRTRYDRRWGAAWNRHVESEQEF